MNVAPKTRVLTIFDLVIPALLWWGWSASGWFSVGALALSLTGWVGGAFLISTPVPALKLLGGLAQVCGLALAFIAAPWFAIVAARWAWGQWA
jgi:hypothetical protein